MLILNDQQVRAVLGEYGRYFNEARPPQALRQVVPGGASGGEKGRGGSVVGQPIHNGLHTTTGARRDSGGQARHGWTEPVPALG